MALFNAHRRKVLTSVTLGCWLFAFVVGIVHACGLDGEPAGSQHVIAASIDSRGCQGDGDTHSGCKTFCAESVPVLAKGQSAQDQPVGPALLLQPLAAVPLLAPVASVPSPLQRRNPPPGVFLNTRYVRLAL